MFKLGTALVFAVTAAAMVMLSALIHDARISVVLLRGLTGFLVAGLVVYGLAVLFEKLEFPKLWRGISDEELQGDLQNQQNSPENMGSTSDNGDDTDNIPGNEADEPGDGGFKPLNEENLQRITIPEDRQQ